MKLAARREKSSFLEANDLMRDYLFELEDVMIRAKLASNTN